MWFRKSKVTRQSLKKLQCSLNPSAMHISELSADVLSIIVSLANGYDVLRIISTGNRVLTAKITTGTKSLKFVAKPFTAFPFSAFNFRHLDSLSVCLPSGYPSIPLRLQDRIPLPDTPALCLSSLRLGFAQSFSVLTLEGNTPLLTRVCPHLKSLTLLRSRVVLQPKHLEALPRSITHLQLQPVEGDEPSGISFLCLSHLPPNLETLIAKGVPVLPDATSKTYEGLVWPSNLRKLSMGPFRGSNILLHLPPLIESLEIRITDNQAPPLIYTSTLPKTLKECKIYGPYTGGEYIVPDGVFPPNLNRLQVMLKASSLNDLAGMPPSIEMCSSFGEIFRPADMKRVAAQFSNITSLSVLYRITSPEEIECLPARLQTLRMPNCISPWHALPSTLTALYTRLHDAQVIALLPRGLKCLILQDLSKATFTKKDFALLPLGLVEIQFDLDNIDSVECLDALPASISDLSLTTSQATRFEIRSDPTLSHHLGHLVNLETFTFSSSAIPSCWRDWIVNLTDSLEDAENSSGARLVVSSPFKKLKNLWTYVDSDEEEVAEKEAQILRRLPPSLTTLVLTLVSNLSQFTHLFSNLPPSLSSLNLQTSHLEDNGYSREYELCDEQFSSLPSHVCNLDISQSLGLTCHFFDVVHPYIAELIVPESLAGTAQHQKYFLSPIWEGHGAQVEAKLENEEEEPTES